MCTITNNSAKYNAFSLKIFMYCRFEKLLCFEIVNEWGKFYPKELSKLKG